MTGEGKLPFSFTLDKPSGESFRTINDGQVGD
jgi:hypothetical protein